MPAMSLDPRLPFFDALAERWDRDQDLERLSGRLDAGLEALGVGRSERVLDAGCGTGNLTLALARRLGPAGRIRALDLSPRMLAWARTKLADPRVTWIQAPLQALPADVTGLDRAILMGVWPHLDDRDAVLDLLHGRIRPGGRLHVWHLASRETINAIHAAAHPSVAGDLLEPPEAIAQALRRHGFEILECWEDVSESRVSGRRS